jgi:GAF domain-containing protein
MKTGPPRQQLLLDCFVDLADPAGVDEAVLLRRLVHRCTQLLDVQAAAVVLAQDDGPAVIAAASSQRAARVARVDATDGGPAVLCIRTGEPVACPDLERPDSGWIRFASAAREAGFTAAYALPVRTPSGTIGALSLLRVSSANPFDEDLLIGQALADVAAAGVLLRRDLRSRNELVGQLQSALSNRIIIEQAKGVLAERLGVDVRTAYELMRQYARSHHRRVSEVAAAAVAGEITLSSHRR